MTDLERHVMGATHWWASERDEADRSGTIDRRVVLLVPQLFRSAEALHLAVQGAPSKWNEERMAKVSCGGRFNMVFGTSLSPERRILFRGPLALVSDIHCCSKALLEMPLDTLGQPISDVYSSVSPFRALRNLFVHLDSALSDLAKHGICGPLDVDNGDLIEYRQKARHCFHLVVDGNDVYFTCYGKATKTTIDKASFDPLWKAMRSVYATITSHKIHPSGYPTSEALFS